MISILIVNYNGAAHLPECLDSLFSQDSGGFEVVLVDNASRDGSLDLIARGYPAVKVIRSEKNLGFAGGNNLGLKYCRGEYVFLLNNDTRLDKKALNNLEQAIGKHPDTDIFACFMIRYDDPGLADSAGDTLYTWGFPFTYSGFPVSLFQEEKPVASACAGAAVFKRTVLENLGGFDEEFFLLFEDLDLGLRAQHAGYETLFLPSVRVLHKGSASIGGRRSPTYFYHCERNILWLLVKNFPLPSLLRALLPTLAMKAFHAYTALRLGLLGNYVRANWHCLLGMPRMIGKRRVILSESRLPNFKFRRLLRPDWVRERFVHPPYIPGKPAPPRRRTGQK